LTFTLLICISFKAAFYSPSSNQERNQGGGGQGAGKVVTNTMHISKMHCINNKFSKIAKRWGLSAPSAP